MSRENLEGWIVDSMRFCRPNVVSCKIVDGNRKTPLIGAYLPPPNLDHLPDLEESLN